MPSQPFAVRRSSIHGRGGFATRAIRAGALVAEYTGARISADEAATRTGSDDGHTMLFELDDDTVLDGSRGGNDSRWINHSCAPNCEVEIDRGRVFIRARRAIATGEELAFDYALVIDGPYRAVWTRRYRCACGAARCRGTMLRLRAQNRVGPAWERLAATRRRRDPPVALTAVA
jgi:SET domain-containing protein